MVTKSDLIPLYIDSDNALGSPFGDVDDGFAIAALTKDSRPIEAIATVFGNTFEPLVFRNHRSLASVCEFSGKIVRGAATWWSADTEASRFLAALTHPITALALGPMTNFSRALSLNKDVEEKIAELVFIGTNLTMPLPAFRFIDFNQWKDPRATRAIFDSRIPLTCIPCDIARKFRVSEVALNELSGPCGAYLRKHSARWFRRSRFLKGLNSVPMWDLVPAMYVLAPSLFEVNKTRAELGRMGQAVFGCQGGRAISVVTGFEPDKVWERFKTIINA